MGESREPVAGPASKKCSTHELSSESTASTTAIEEVSIETTEHVGSCAKKSVELEEPAAGLEPKQSLEVAKLLQDVVPTISSNEPPPKNNIKHALDSIQVPQLLNPPAHDKNQEYYMRAQ